MKATCLQDAMRHALQMTGRFTPARTPLIIAQAVLVRAQGDMLRMTATNLEMTIRVNVPAEVEREGSLAIPNRLFSELVATLPHEPMLMETKEEDSRLTIRSGTAKAHINSEAAGLFPPTPEVEPDTVVRIETQEFRRAVNRVHFCTATEMTRPVLAGILLNIEGEEMTTVGSNGYQLGVQCTPIPPQEGRISAVVPARAMHEVQRLADGWGDTVEIIASDDGRNIRFRIGSEEPDDRDIEVTSALLNGNFPDYQQLIPSGMTTGVTLDVGEIGRLARRSSIFAKDETNTVIFEMIRRGAGEEGDRGIIRSVTNELGDNRADFTVRDMTGESARIGLNNKHLLNVLTNLNCPDLLLEMNSPSSPVKITLPEEGGYTHVMMPVLKAETMQP